MQPMTHHTVDVACLKLAAVALVSSFVLMAPQHAQALETRATCWPYGHTVDGDFGPQAVSTCSASARFNPVDTDSVISAFASGSTNAATGTFKASTRTLPDYRGGPVVEGYIKEAIVIDQPWTGGLDTRIGFSGDFISNLGNFYAAGAQNGGWVTLRADVSSTEFHARGQTDIFYTDEGVFNGGLANGNYKWMPDTSFDFLSGSFAEDSVTGLQMHSDIALPDRLVGHEIFLEWHVRFWQMDTGFIDASNTSYIGLQLPDGYTYTPSSGEFLSAVPIPAAAWLFGPAVGIFGYFGRRQKNR